MPKSKKKTQTPFFDREAIDGEAILANRKFWTVRGAVHVNTGYTNVEAILAPGDTDMIIVRDHLGFAIIDSKPAVLEFEFMLTLN